MVTKKNLYNTQLGAGLGLFQETKTLFELWQPEMTVNELYQSALSSGRFPMVTARRLHNIIKECFYPRYLSKKPVPALFIKTLIQHLSSSDLKQIMLIYTCRANLILSDFIRQVYWQRYAAGYTEITNEESRQFVVRAIDDGLTIKRWSDTTVQNVAGYLTGCCGEYGLLESGQKTTRRILSFMIAPDVVTFLAYDLHFSGLGDNALLSHEDWQLFGLSREDVLEEMKRLALKGHWIVQAAGDVVRISWKYQTLEEVCHVLAES